MTELYSSGLLERAKSLWSAPVSCFLAALWTVGRGFAVERVEVSDCAAASLEGTMHPLAVNRPTMSFTKHS